ncbi:hypothetical protein QN382_00455 [Pseudomonas sp. 10B1]|uniref:hypothetical protein n=1 Tax=unclassified Pseudomonas TaxID=196821 RepID=UPI002AB4BB18|nr:MULTISPECIES: hypothetical protein [unclassified Pseudomonas]MDY7560687.1 hypothetical protein [Pseudomonas sp. AB6]MEA9976916.1 hypothetical protein [Pseudomonas sp. RTS4]MEA9996075.1 hypothetical protein [Pseudomonas sp. AA4]MEB0087398.1 hypothetical protein [Pseudomonas sp. RTI1]MEB0127970.1 hypothetical protein [Pseudomonas sp. CCC1.2]
MSCLICAGHAETIECAEGWEQRNCPHCGPYRISQALVLTLMEQGQIFDTGKMRRWLDAQRSDVPIPSIEVHEALLML